MSRAMELFLMSLPDKEFKEAISNFENSGDGLTDDEWLTEPARESALNRIRNQRRTK